MSVVSQDTVTKTDVIARFNERVRDWVGANTNWITNTSVFNTTVGFVTANSTSYGGSINRVTHPTPAPTAVLSNDSFTDPVGANKDLAGHVVKVLKDIMVIYANNHKIDLINTGNLAPASYTGVARLNGAPATLQSNIISDVDAAAVSNSIIPGNIITATQMNSFIESCRNIWNNRANSASIESFQYSYCHNSCHSNVTCYSARGRR